MVLTPTPQQHMTLNAPFSPWGGHHKHLTVEKSTLLGLQIRLQGLVESSGSEWLLHQTPLRVALKGCGEEKSPLVGHVWGGICDCPLCVEGDVLRLRAILIYDQRLSGLPGRARKECNWKTKGSSGGGDVGALLGRGRGDSVNAHWAQGSRGWKIREVWVLVALARCTDP